MNRRRTLAVAAAALGVAGLSIALGSLYHLRLRFVRAATEIELLAGAPDPSQRDLLLMQMLPGPEFWVALVSGTLGAALVAAAMAVGVFELRCFLPDPRDQKSRPDTLPRHA